MMLSFPHTPCWNPASGSSNTVSNGRGKSSRKHLRCTRFSGIAQLWVQLPTDVQTRLTLEQLDEAHNIKERSTSTAKAAFELKTRYRWCLSGTPLQNRVGELYSLVRFLGGDPFSYYFCRSCDCKSLHWKFSNKRQCDGMPVFFLLPTNFP